MRAAATAGHRGPRGSVIASAVRNLKQTLARKELQKRAKQEYLRRTHEAAYHVDKDQLVFDLQPASPRVRAELKETAQHAALNQQLIQQVPELLSLRQVYDFIHAYQGKLNFLTVVAIARQAAAVLQAVELNEDDSSGRTPSAADVDAAPPATSVTITALPLPDSELAATAAAHVAALVVQHSSWFQPPQFASTFVALSQLGVQEEAVWDNMTAAAEHKLAAFTFAQLAAVSEALAAVGYTPRLAWVEHTYRQAAKHLHVADAADIAVLMGAWGDIGYTPRDRLFLNQVKVTMRRAFDQDQLSGMQLVQVMHGISRMPRYAPNQGWLAALAEASLVHLRELTPGALVDLLLSFVALEHTPHHVWLDSVLERLELDMQSLLQQQQQQQQQALQPASDSDSSMQLQVLQPDILFLPPLDLQQLSQQQQLERPGLLLQPDHVMQVPGAQWQQQQQDLPVEPSELDQLQAMLDDVVDDDADVGNDADDASADVGGLETSTRHKQYAQLPNLQPASTKQLDSSAAVLSLGQEANRQQLTQKHLGVLCWCLARLQYQPSPAWMQLLGEVLLVYSTSLAHEVAVDILQGVVSIKYHPIGVLQQLLLQQVTQALPCMTPEELMRTGQALAAWEAGLQQYKLYPDFVALQLAPQQQQHRSSGRSARAPTALTGLQQGVPSHLEDLSSLQQQIATSMVDRLGSSFGSCSTVQVANVLAYVAAAEITPSFDFMVAAVSRAVKMLPVDCPTPATCTLLWALARMGFKPHPQLLHQLLAVLQRGLHLLSSQDLADAGWALCTLRHRPSNTWLALYHKEVAAKATSMSPQALTDTLWALACFNSQPDREWLKRMLQVVGKAAAAGQLSQQNAAVIVWALQQLGFVPGALGLLPAGSGDASGRDSRSKALGGSQGDAGDGAVQQHARASGFDPGLASLMQLVVG